MTSPPKYGEPGQPGHDKARFCPHSSLACARECSRSEPCKRQVDADKHRARTSPGAEAAIPLYPFDERENPTHEEVPDQGDQPEPPQAHARNTDPETSHEAAASITPSKITANQHAVRQLLVVFGSRTDREIRALYTQRQSQYDLPRQSDSGLRTRRAEMVAMNPPLVRWTGRWRERPDQRRSRIWEAVE